MLRLLSRDESEGPVEDILHEEVGPAEVEPAAQTEEGQTERTLHLWNNPLACCFDCQPFFYCFAESDQTTMQREQRNGRKRLEDTDVLVNLSQTSQPLNFCQLLLPQLSVT